MPYFKEIDLLFIHIPKTGGSLIENYFYTKLSLFTTIDTLYSCKHNFANDKLYYQKIMEIKKPIIEPLNTLMAFAKLEKTFK